jgi:cytochrome P450
MAFYPEVQEKVYEEMQTVYSSVDEEITEDHIKQLVYLDLVIKESLRFWTPVPYYGRCLTQDIEIGESSFLVQLNILMIRVH